MVGCKKIWAVSVFALALAVGFSDGANASQSSVQASGAPSPFYTLVNQGNGSSLLTFDNTYGVNLFNPIGTLFAPYAALFTTSHGHSSVSVFSDYINFATPTMTVSNLTGGVVNFATAFDLFDIVDGTTDNAMLSFNVTSVTTTSNNGSQLDFVFNGTFLDAAGNTDANFLSAVFGQFDPAGSVTVPGGNTYIWTGNLFAPTLPPPTQDTSIPEPMSIGILGAGLAALGMMRRRFKK